MSDDPLMPLRHLPGFAQWGRGLERLLEREEMIWVFGPTGSGTSSVARHLAHLRGVACLEVPSRETSPTGTSQQVPERLPQTPGIARAVVAAHEPPDPDLPGIPLRLWALEEDPGAIPRCLEALAAREGLSVPLPPALGRLPCPANLLELKNRLVRWALLGQLPEELGGPGPDRLPLEEDDLALNLHHLERLLLHRALRRAYGNRVEAARRLGISRPQLYQLIARHGDPVRGEPSRGLTPRRLQKRQNSSAADSAR